MGSGTRRIGTAVAVIAAGAVLATTVAAIPALAAPKGPVRPGPELLYAEPPRAPQLENTGIWEADPIGICHTSAYRDGEYVHQGCVYDDQGGGNQYRWPNDTYLRNYTYPEAADYRRNAADILEVRVKPVDGATAFRVTLNTLIDPELFGITLALGDSATPRPAPHGANTVLPAQRFVTVHGEQGDIVDAATGETLPETPDVTVDVERRQVEIRVPDSAFAADGEQRIAAAAGLWGDGGYLVPQLTADETHPGGAVIGDDSPSAFFDSAFRFDEPFEAPYRDNDQKRAVADGDLSPFFAAVDFDALRAGTDDESGVPTTGYLTRVFASAFETEQGRRLPSDPGGPPPGTGTQQGGITTGSGEGAGDQRPSFAFGWPCRDDCVPDLPGRIQRYMVYVPEAQAPADGYPSLVWTNGYALRPGDDVAGERDLYQQFAERPGNPTMVIDVDGRGQDQWGYGQSGASIFEAVADARRHYDLDTERTAMGGFSSGGYMANKLSLTFPDVFSTVFICDGLDVAPSFPGLNGVADTLPVDTLTNHEAGSKLTPLLPSRRNQPVMEWAGVNDDFIPYNITRERADAYAAGDYDYEFISWTGVAAEHLVMCKNGMWDLATDWMGDEPRAVDPHHVSYVRNPLMDDPESGLVGDRAYWLSDIQSRDGELARIDVVTRGLGVTDAPVPPSRSELGVAEGTFFPVNPYLREARALDEPVAAPAENVLEITGVDVGTVTIDPQRAGVDCAAELRVTTNGPLDVTLLGCDRTESFDGSGPGLESYDPADPLEPLGNPAQGAPIPAEVGNAPQPPLTGLPPLRFPPNVGGDPRPSGG